MNIELNLGDKIKACRILEDLTQQELALKIGKTVSSIKKYESGYTTPPIEVIEKIAKALNTPVTSLMYGNNQNKDIIDEINSILDSPSEINKILNTLDENELNSLQKHIKLFYKKLKEQDKEVICKNSDNNHKNINVNDLKKCNNEDAAMEHLKSIICYVGGDENLSSEVYNIIFSEVCNTIKYELYKLNNKEE